MSDIFMSYAHEDRESAKALAAVLERRGWTVWWDRRIRAGEEFADVIDRELTAARCVIVLWSRASVASDWVQNEAADAKERRRLLPVLLEEVRLPLEFRRIHAADLVGWQGEDTHAGLSTLVSDLTDRLGAPAAGDAEPTAPAAGVDAGRGGVAEEPVARDERPDEVRRPVGLRTPVADPEPRREPETRREPEPPRPPTPFNRRLIIIGGGALAAIILAVLVFALTRRSGPSRETNTATAGPSNVTVVTNNARINTNANRNTNTATPTSTVAATPPPPPGQRSDERIKSLLDQLNSPDQQVRRGKTAIMKEEFGSDPRAVEQALARLDEARLGELTPQGLINILFFLNESRDEAWTPDSVRKANAAVGVLERKQLGAQAAEAVGKLKARVATLRGPVKG